MTKAQLRALAVLGILSVVGNVFTKAESQSGLSLSSPHKEDEAVPVSVPDMIQMTQPGNSRFQGGIFDKHGIARFSPDGKSFVILLKRGNIAADANEYWIEYFRTDAVMHEKHGRTLVRFSSTSNRPAIRQIEWLDNSVITFLAERPAQVQQLYKFDLARNRLTRLTNSTTNLTSYAIGTRNRSFAFCAEEPYQKLPRSSSGIVISSQPLVDLLIDRNAFAHRALSYLYINDARSGTAYKVNLEDQIPIASPMYLSPDGRYLVIKTMRSRIPPLQWRKYDIDTLQSQLRAEHRDGETQLIYQFQLVDLTSRKGRPLLDAPIPSEDYPDVVWSPDSKSVMLSNILLPLDRSNQISETGK
jgi:hypothetical protein